MLLGDGVMTEASAATTTGSAGTSGSSDTPPGSGSTLPKAPTGIRGLDEITGGGLPRGRPTLVAGASGCGKTLLGVEFLVRGALEFGEPGVLVSFEESASDIAANVASLGFDLERMQADGQLVVDSIHIDPGEIVEAGAFDLEGLFLRLGFAVDSVKAKRVVLDTVEVLLTALPHEAVVRGELGRLFRWLKDRGLTTVVTGERGKEELTRHGIEEYVSDCVILLDQRVSEELSTRRLRIVKYRGATHGTNEYPFLINERGLVVLPVTSLYLAYEASPERVSTGLPRLDHMLGGGVYRGTAVLISGGAGSGKTIIAAQMAAAACGRGEKALFVSFEESPAQLVRDVASVGVDLRRWVDGGLLRLSAKPATASGLESHLADLVGLLDESEPALVVLDGVMGLGQVGSLAQVRLTVTRQLAMLKARGITAVLTTLTDAGPGATLGETSGLVVSSLVDSWLLLRNVETNGERNRLLFVLKSRGSAHSNQVREFVLTDTGAQLLDVYVGAGGVLTGTARLSQETADRVAAGRRGLDVERRRRVLHEHNAQVEARIAELRRQLADEAAEVEQFAAELDQEHGVSADARVAMARQRWADPPPNRSAAAEPGGAR